MASNYGLAIPTNNLEWLVDAGNAKSYPGTGTIWYDLSANGRNQSLIGGANYTTINNVACIDTSSGGKYTVDAGTTYTFTAEYTMIAWARALADSQVGDWRTLWRTTPDDHPLLIQDGSNTIGYYDNNAAGFVSYGLNLATIGKENVWAMYTIIGSGSTSTLYIDNRTFSGSVNYNANGNSHDAFGAGPGYAQYFGYVAIGMIYSRAITLSEIDQIFYAYRQRFGV